MLDSVNKQSTAIAGMVFIVLAILANQQAQAALITLFSHPTLQGTLTAVGTLAGVVLLYIAKPLGTSPAPPKGP